MLNCILTLTILLDLYDLSVHTHILLDVNKIMLSHLHTNNIRNWSHISISEFTLVICLVKKIFQTLMQSQWSTFFCTIKIALHFIQLSGKCYVKWLTNRKGIEKQFFSIKSKKKIVYIWQKHKNTGMHGVCPSVKSNKQWKTMSLKNCCA